MLLARVHRLGSRPFFLTLTGVRFPVVSFFTEQF